MSFARLKSLFFDNWVIVLIVFLAFALRLVGVTYGLPGQFIGDEKSLVGGSLKMIYERNIIPGLAPDQFRLLYYPVLIPWIYLIFFVPWLLWSYFIGGFQSFSAVRDYFIVNPESFFLIARVVNVIFSSATIFLVYLSVKRIFSKQAGLYSALIYAVSWFAVEQGHFSKHWNIAGFFAWLSLLFTFSIIKSPSRKNYLLAGMAIGLAGMANYIYAIFGIFLLLCHFLFSTTSFKKRFFDSRFWLAVLTALVLFIIGVFIYPQEFYRLFFGEDSTATAAKNLIDFWLVIKEVFFTLFYLETVLLLLAVIGAISLFFRDKKIFLMLAFLPLVSPFLYYFFLHFEPRYVLLFLPALGILAGFGMEKILELFKVKSGVFVLLACLVVVFLPLKNLAIFDIILTKTDSRILAKEWVQNNLPPGTKIITSSWEFNLVRSQDCIYDQQQKNNLSLRSRDYVMWANSFPNSYCVWPLDLVQSLPDNYQEYQYYITDDQTARQYSYSGDDLLSHLQLVKKFPGTPVTVGESRSDKFISQTLSELLPGPNVYIYKLDFNPPK